MTMEMGGPLDDGGIAPGPDPFALFHSWMKEAEASETNDPNAMAVATVDADGMPLGLQIMGAAGQDALVLEIASRLERV